MRIYLDNLNIHSYLPESLSLLLQRTAPYLVVRSGYNLEKGLKKPVLPFF